jgi:hypothetical protein
MIRLSKSVLAVGGVVLAGGLIMVMNPRAVHAVSAALVQVTNTAANPAVTQSVGAQAGNLVHLSCAVPLSGLSVTCNRVAADTSITTNYTVPAGESLVITAMDVWPLGPVCPGTYTISLGSPSFAGVFLQLPATDPPATIHFVYPSGPVIGEGITPTLASSSSACDSSLEVVAIFGYLTAA